MKELISNDLINRIRESKSNAEARRYILTALQKAKQKEAIEQSTNWQMKEEALQKAKEKTCSHCYGTKKDHSDESCETPCPSCQQPELSAEEFLNKHTPFLVKSYNRSKAINPFVSASARAQVIKHLARKLTEFKNQNR